MRKTAMLCVTTLAAVLMADGLRAENPPSPTTLPAAGRRTVEAVGFGMARIPTDVFTVDVTVRTDVLPPEQSDAETDRLVDAARERIRAAGVDPDLMKPTTRPTTARATFGDTPLRITQRREFRLALESPEAAERVAKAFRPTEGDSMKTREVLNQFDVRAHAEPSAFEAKSDELLEAATREAISQARREAAAIARAADGKLGKVIAVGRLERNTLAGDLKVWAVAVRGIFVFEMTD